MWACRVSLYVAAEVVANFETETKPDPNNPDERQGNKNKDLVLEKVVDSFVPLVIVLALLTCECPTLRFKMWATQPLIWEIC